MNNARIYFSNYQAKDGLITNLIHKVKTTGIVNKALKLIGIEYATIYNGVGIYQGGTEKSIQLYICGVDVAKCNELCEKIKAEFHQDSVMLEFNGEVSFI